MNAARMAGLLGSGTPARTTVRLCPGTLLLSGNLYVAKGAASGYVRLVLLVGSDRTASKTQGRRRTDGIINMQPDSNKTPVSYVHCVGGPCQRTIVHAHGLQMVCALEIHRQGTGTPPSPRQLLGLGGSRSL